MVGFLHLTGSAPESAVAAGAAATTNLLRSASTPSLYQPVGISTLSRGQLPIYSSRHPCKLDWSDNLNSTLINLSWDIEDLEEGCPRGIKARLPWEHNNIDRSNQTNMSRSSDLVLISNLLTHFLQISLRKDQPNVFNK
nr:PREDICTED: uncharacterized protein LOC108213106 [Daucus carota subsp. sativus]XP_017240785.1 PREDICTED: uncharacterized protein LOC108213495 [Daucus carota subsp. sativus]